MGQPIEERNARRPDRRPSPARWVVGIGASAGGLDALEKLLGNMPRIGGCAFVVVTHLSPDFKSLLDELLERRTDMQVKVVDDGEPLHANVVYVIPPNTDMITAQGKLLLKPRDRDAAAGLPVDVFFRSLAQEYRERAIAVLLSGSGSDGSRSLSSLRDQSGFVVVQNPTDAKFDGMPRAAIATGNVDKVANVESIGRIVADRVASAMTGNLPLTPKEDDGDERVREIARALRLIHTVSDVDFTGYKTGTIYRRMRRRMLLGKWASLADYVDSLAGNIGEVHELTGDLLIGVTQFFRDREAFRVLDEHVITQLVERSSPTRPIRIWVPACSTGQEAYSIAIRLYMAGRRMGKAIDPQIFATDIQGRAIEFAARGVYRREDVDAARLSPDTMELCFTQVDEEHLEVASRIRRWIVFAPQNILTDPPFTRLDLVSCRNALVYLTAEAQQKALSLFSFSLRDGGALFLGPSESLGVVESDFEAIDARWRIFRKVASTAATPIAARRSDATTRTRREIKAHSAAALQRPAVGRLNPAYATLLNALVPSGVLISLEREVLHIFGDATRLLQLTPGEMRPDLLSMVGPQLRLALAIAIERVVSGDNTVSFIADVGDGERVKLGVMGLDGRSEGDLRFMLVRFGEAPTEVESVALPAADLSALAEERIGQLEEEIDGLQATIEANADDSERSSEELQSTNEELMVANEELQSTNEELQSVNEELYTVNAEYQKKNDELLELSRDVESLMAATEIGVVFVDDRMIIKRFTSAAAEVMNLMQQDVGRSLAHITHSLLNTDLLSLVRQALRTRRPLRIENMSQTGRWWQLRIIPLKASKGQSDGAVITMYDVTEVKAAEIVLREKTTELAKVVQLTGARAVRYRRDGVLIDGAEGWCEVTGQTAKDASGLGWLEAVHPADRARLMKLWRAPSSDDSSQIETLFRITRSDDATLRHCRFISQREYDEHGNFSGWSSVVIDIEHAVQADEIVRSRGEVLSAVMRMSPGWLAYIGADRRLRYISDSFTNALGVSQSDAVGRSLKDILSADEHEQMRAHIEAALEGVPASFELTSRGVDGAPVTRAVVLEPDRDAENQISGIAMNAVEIGPIRAPSGAGDIHGTIGHAMVDSDVMVMSVSRKTGDVLFASPALVRATGFSAVELRRRRLGDLFISEDGPQVQGGADGASDIAAASAIRAAVRTRLLRRSGDSLPVALRFAMAEGGTSDAIVVVLTDDRHAVKTETTLAEKSAELERSNRTLELFAAAATHEMKEPLRKLDKFSELLVEDFGEALGPDGTSTIGVIVQAAARMRRIIDSVVDLAAMERATVSAAKVDLDETLERVLVDLSKAIADAGTSIEIAPLPQVAGDRTKLEILFRNLLLNALKHARHDDTALELRITLETEDDESATIAVSDNGLGISASRLEAVFEPFTQFGPDRSGSGVGLALCQRIATAHGGDIKITRNDETGVTFSIRLPRGA